jgi:hypothetical protein
MKRTPKISGRNAIMRISFCPVPQGIKCVADNSDRQALSNAEYGPEEEVFNRDGGIRASVHDI